MRGLWLMWSNAFSGKPDLFGPEIHWPEKRESFRDGAGALWRIFHALLAIVAFSPPLYIENVLRGEERLYEL